MEFGFKEILFGLAGVSMVAWAGVIGLWHTYMFPRFFKEDSDRINNSSPVTSEQSSPTGNSSNKPWFIDDEGGTLTVTVNTTGISSGTTLYYTLDGIGIAPADFTDNITSGSFVIDSSETGSFTKTLVTDLTTESTETFKVNIRSKKIFS